MLRSKLRAIPRRHRADELLCKLNLHFELSEKEKHNRLFEERAWENSLQATASLYISTSEAQFGFHLLLLIVI
jgi:hypothetical protein